MSNIEVECRALLTRHQRDDLLSYMHTLRPVREVDRIMIDYSGDNRQRTVTLRINNGRQELVAKSGGLADNTRHEAVILLDPQVTLETSLSYLNIMGYEDAMLSLRKMYVVSTDEYEYSLRDVIHPITHKTVSTLLDLEALSKADNAGQDLMEKLHRILKLHNLEPLGKAEWESWVKKIYEQVDRPFYYSPDSARDLAQLVVGATS